MRYITFFFALVFFLTFISTTNNAVFADDDYDYNENYKWDNEDEDERYEDFGETLGWGIVGAMGAAGIIFPMRRLTKTVIGAVPSAKKGYLSLTKWLGKYHILIGVTAILLSIGHGVIMYLSEGELDFDGIIGLSALILLLVAGSVGTILFKNKKVKILRTTHTILIVCSIAIGAFHILIS